MTEIDLTDYERPVQVRFHHDSPRVTIEIPILVSPDWVRVRYDLTQPDQALAFGKRYKELADQFRFEVGLR
jgi:hypothetical protein